MTVADPKCERCGARKIWIGIGPGAEAVCSRECADKCPNCLSTEIKPFVRWSYWSPLPTPSRSEMHCVACGRVFAKVEQTP